MNPSQFSQTTVEKPITRKREHQIFIVVFICVALLSIVIAGIIIFNNVGKDDPIDPIPLFGIRQINTSIPIPIIDAKVEDYHASRINSIESLRPALNTWKERMLKDPIPTDSFRAYYFNKSAPEKVIKTEIVSHISYSNMYNVYNNKQNDIPIPSQQFGGYWIGNITIPQSEEYLISANVGGKSARLIVDGYEMPDDITITTLTKGTHEVAYELLSEWGSLGVDVSFVPAASILSIESIASNITKGSDFDVWYAGVRGPYNKDHSVVVDSTQVPTKPLILLLNSYELIHWKISPALYPHLAYIIVRSDQPGSTVTSSLSPKNIFTLKPDSMEFIDGIKTECWTDAYPPRCDNVNNLETLNTIVTKLTDSILTGFAIIQTDSGITTLSLPGMSITKDILLKVKTENMLLKATAEKEALQIKNKAQPETLFNE